MAESRIDVSIETRDAPPPARRDPNTCPTCQSHYRDDELAENLHLCAHCGHHFPMPALARVASLADPDSFVEEAAELRSDDPLWFFDLRPYPERLAEAEMSTGLGDAIVVGHAAVEGHPCVLAVMDFRFMGGSMGSVVGEKFSRACDLAGERGAPLVSVAASGGARMQEGILALMQLPKTVCAVEDLKDSGGSMISVLTNQTTGGLLASFASLGDVVVAEPGALMSFSGPRVVESVTREKLPEDFGRAEPNYRFGHLDAMVPRRELRPAVAKLVRLLAPQ